MNSPFSSNCNQTIITIKETIQCGYNLIKIGILNEVFTFAASDANLTNLLSNIGIKSSQNFLEDPRYLSSVRNTSICSCAMVSPISKIVVEESNLFLLISPPLFQLIIIPAMSDVILTITPTVSSSSGFEPRRSCESLLFMISRNPREIPFRLSSRAESLLWE